MHDDERGILMRMREVCVILGGEVKEGETAVWEWQVSRSRGLDLIDLDRIGFREH